MSTRNTAAFFALQSVVLKVSVVFLFYMLAELLVASTDETVSFLDLRKS